jgi:hypothetical protein
MKFKKCYTCKRKLPRIMYSINTSKYQRESALGVCYNCRLCCYKQAIKWKGYITKIDNKFQFVNATKKEIIIKFFLKK